MAPSSIDQILANYDAQASLIGEFAERVQGLVVDVLNAGGIRYHSVTCRLKSRSSLSRKLSKPERVYDQLTDITDLAGVRIITYFADDVDKVAALLAKEFVIDVTNSVDKRASLDPDRFGYLSLHHVVGLTATRAALTEYQRFPSLRVGEDQPRP